MKKYYLFIFTILFFLISISSLVADSEFVIRFNQPDEQTVNKFSSDRFDIAAFKPGKFLDIVVTDAEYQKIVAQGFTVEITQTEEQLKNNLHGDTELDGYRDYDELLIELQQIENNYPELCKLYDIGDSWGKLYSDNGVSNYDNYNHEIWALKLSDNVEIDEDEPGIYYLAAHHSREPISLEVVMTVLEHILDNYGTDPTITENVNNQQIWFVPLVNPNGHKIVTDEQNVWWRKNIFDNNENTLIDVTGNYAQDGVDPNRNYGWEWGGASNNWTSETYQGTSAFSEPETQAIRNLLAEHHFLAGLTYHSYSELILFPYGYEDGVVAPDFYALQELAVNMAETIEGQNGGYYDPMPGWELYSATGTTDDYAYGMHGIFEYTIELATEFIPPANQVEEICENNIEAAMIMLDRASHSILQGHITNSTTNEPLEAMVFIDGIDNSGAYREPYMSNDEFGSYYRLLTDGNYDVTYSAYGYDSQTFEDIMIDDNITSLDVALTPSSNTINLSGVVVDGDTGEPVENATIAIQEFGISPVTTNSNGEYSIDGLFEYNYSIAVYSPVHAGIFDQYLVTSTNDELDFNLYTMPDGTFENSEFASSWDLSGNNNWVIDDVTVYSGNYAAKSGTIYDDQISSMAVSLFVQEDGEISFYQKVSSETDYDYLRFYIDNTLEGNWSGNGSWEFHTYNVESGFHTFKWEYYKDGGVSSYQDCGWIDEITFPSSSVIVTPTVLEFLDETSLEGLEFSIINNTLNDIVINNIDDEGNAEISWYIENFNLVFPYTMTAGEQLDFIVMIAMPVINENREIVTDLLYIETSVGDYQIEIIFDTSLYSSSENGIPAITRFNGNYPNPFNPSTTFSYSLANESSVTLTLFNIKGQKIRTLVKEEQTAGLHQVNWDGTDNHGKKVSTGIYFSHCDIADGDGDYTSVKKIILMK